VVQSIVKLGGSIGIVEHNQNGTHAGGGKEDGDILFTIARHDANAIALVNAHGQHSPGEAFGLVL
jgi:hypothetical protein